MSKCLHPCGEIKQTMERIYRYRMTATPGGSLSLWEPGGVLVVGASVLEAFDRLEVFESTAELKSTADCSARSRRCPSTSSKT